MPCRRRVIALSLTVLVALVFAFGPAGSGAGAQEVTGIEQSPAGADQPVVSWSLAPAGAADPGGPTDRPNLTYDVAAGTTVDDAVDVANWGEVPLLLHVYAADAINNDSGGFDLIHSDEESEDAGSWVQIEQKFLTIAPKTAARIPITITVPVDATAGDHVAGVVAALTSPGTGADGKTVTLEQRTGTRLFVRVQGPLQPDLAVEGVSTSYTPKVNPVGGTATVTYTVVNRGNTRMKGSQRVKVGGPFGLFSKTSQARDLPEMLPGQSVEFTETIDGVAATGLLTTEVKLDGEEVVSDTAEPATAAGSTISLAIPWLLVALFAIVVLLLIARRQYLRQRQPLALPSGGGVGPAGPGPVSSS